MRSGLDFADNGTVFAEVDLKFTFQGKTMLFSFGDRDKNALSRRSRAFIRIHHLAVLGLMAWIGYLFAMRELI